LGKICKLMVEADGRLQKAFPVPPMVCLKQGKNLGDKLIRSRLKQRSQKRWNKVSPRAREGVHVRQNRKEGMFPMPLHRASSGQKPG
jgi:hypothetical protein